MLPLLFLYYFLSLLFSALSSLPWWILYLLLYSKLRGSSTIPMHLSRARSPGPAAARQLELCGLYLVLIF